MPRQQFRFLLAFAVMSFVAANPLPALAWGESGHRIVAAIAERMLTQAARAEVDRILADEPAHGVPECPVANLQDAARWADCVRPLKAYAYSATWHFDDIPLCGAAHREAYCAEGNCLSAQTERLIGVLSDRTADRKARLEALKFVVHFIGDLHQPLHASDNGDRGGNDVPTSFFGSADRDGRQNLHRVWDSRLPERVLAGSDDHASTLFAQLDPQEAAAWRQGGIEDWMRETHAIAVDVTYAALPRPLACNVKGGEREALEQAYYDQAAPVVSQQLLKAGVRLAVVLIRSLH
jgi:hypothetical protein